jgi:hypothetical protein
MKQPDFSTWERGNLVNIALEMYLKLQRQEDEIQQLRHDFKDALAAYRKLTIERG